jgi:hypothetical protein
MAPYLVMDFDRSSATLKFPRAPTFFCCTDSARKGPRIPLGGIFITLMTETAVLLFSEPQELGKSPSPG